MSSFRWGILGTGGIAREVVEDLSLADVIVLAQLVRAVLRKPLISSLRSREQLRMKITVIWSMTQTSMRSMLQLHIPCMQSMQY